MVLVVGDDGVGLPGEAASDSSGHPRHARAGAARRSQITVGAVEPHGTEVTLRLPAQEVA